MAAAGYSIEKFKNDYEVHSLELETKKAIVIVPFEKHLEIYESSILEVQKLIGFIITAKTKGDSSRLKACTMQYKHARRQEDRSLARLTHYQALSEWIDELYDILEEAMVLNSISELGLEGMKKAEEAYKVTHDNIWDIEKMAQSLRTSFDTMLSKMNGATDKDYFNQQDDQPAQRDEYDEEIDKAIEESQANDHSVG